MCEKIVNLSIEELRAVFIRPDTSSLPVPDNTEPCDGGRIPIAEHVCAEGASDIWIELQAEHDLKEELAGGPDEWSAWWRAVDDTGSDALRFPLSFCPFCGIRLDDLYDIDGYYRHVGFTDQMLKDM